MNNHRIEIKGIIAPNDYKEFYSFLGIDCTCPEDINRVLDQAEPGDSIDVHINSGGGMISSDSEIYTALREAAQKYDVKIHITGQACSAASVIACAAYCEMSPTALMMVHCVSSSVCDGNHSDMTHMAETLEAADRALCKAYMTKANMTQAEALDMMERETWLTADQAKEKGLVDAIMFQDEKEPLPLVAGIMFRVPTQEQLAAVHNLTKGQKNEEKEIIRLLRWKADKLQKNKT